MLEIKGVPPEDVNLLFEEDAPLCARASWKRDLCVRNAGRCLCDSS